MTSHATARIFGRRTAYLAAAFGAWFAVHAAFAQSTLAITGGPSASEITQDAAVIRWSTGEAATTVVRFGVTPAMAGSQRKVVIVPGAPEEDAYELNHSLTLAELAPATTYYYATYSATSDGRTASSAQMTFTTVAASAPLAGVTLTAPLAGAKPAGTVSLAAKTNGPAATVDFTVKTGSGTQVTKVGATDKGNNENWVFGDLKLLPGPYFVTATAAGKDAAGASATFESAPVAFTVVLRTCAAADWTCGEWGACVKAADGKSEQTRSCVHKADCEAVLATSPTERQICLPSPGCTKDLWFCGEWGACSDAGKKTRKCSLTEDCPTATTPKPAEVADCEPVCKADAWACSEWGKCDKERKERRTCALSFDCPGVATPAKPPEARDCMYTPGVEDVNAPQLVGCDRDVWECGEWGACAAGASRSRTCALAYDCPNEETPKPGESETCTPTASGGTTPFKEGDMFPPVTLLPQASPGERDLNQPETAYEVTFVGVSDPAMQRTLALECRAGGILADRCAAWLAVKYADRSCAERGIFSKEACERGLTAGNGGIFPGCEGKTPVECDGVRARALLGYLPDDAKAKLDAAVGTGDVAGTAGALGGAAPRLFAVRGGKEGAVNWWPSAAAEGQETSPAMLILDADKDGLPDDVEKRLGTDPAKPDIAADGRPDVRTTLRILKVFFAQAGKDAPDVSIDTNGDGKPDAKITRDVLKSFFEKGDKPTQGQFGDVIDSILTKGDKPTQGQFGDVIDSALVAVDVDGDGTPDAKVSRGVLKTFFEKGDKPAQDRFSAVDRALLAGSALGQPRGAGEVDPSFMIGIGSAGGALARADSPADCRNACEADECKTGSNPEDFRACSLACARKCGDQEASPSNVLRGRAAPDATVLLYVYSYVPMVLTTTTDENGNYTYDVGDGLGDGEHTAYVALTDDTGKITKKSEPLSFFVKEAKAVTKDDFIKADVNVAVEPVVQAQRHYLIGAAIAIVLGLGAAWIVVGRRMKEIPPAPPEPPAPAA